MHVLLRLAGYAFRYKGRMALVYLCLIGSTSLSLIIPRLLGDGIDEALSASGSRSRLLSLAWLVGIVALARSAFSYGQSYLSESVSQRVAFDLRNAFLSRLEQLSFAFHDQQKTGDLMSTATYSVESTRFFISFGLIYSWHVVLLLVGVSVLMVRIDWQLGLLGTAAMPVSILISGRIARKLMGMWRNIQVHNGRLTTVLQENLAGMRVVKAFGAEGFEQQKFHEAANTVAEETFRLNRAQAVNSSFYTLLFSLLIALVVWHGGRRIMDGAITAGELTQFVVYVVMMAGPVRMSGFLANTIASAVAAGKRILDVIDAASPVAEKENATALSTVRGEVEFHNVTFAYNSGLPAIQDISFIVLPGQRIALLGPPGGGKSTLVNLIPRFYDPTQGKVTIDGFDLRDLTLKSVRQNVGIVFQDVFLFNTTIRENIAYGVDQASDAQVEQAARAAQLHDFIMTLPKGYDTIIGERGVTLSGGQRQRLAIARTLLLDPPILILDDSTSSVDVETEALIQAALREVMRGRTTFTIAHRASTVQTADLILVLDQGKVVRRGTHQELIHQEGLYREIYRLQLAPEDAIVAQPSMLD